MVKIKTWVFAGAALVAVAISLWLWARPGALSDQDFAARYQAPLPPPSFDLDIYHLGHSLVGRDMPAMLAALGGHDYGYQLGWGASLKGHWTNDIPGYADENIGPNFIPAHQAIGGGQFGIVVLTEMVEIKDAIKYHDSPDYLKLCEKQARSARPDTRLYLYETWHRLDDPQGWDDRIQSDLGEYWEGELLRRAMADKDVGTIYVIPGGQVMLEAVEAIEAGKIDGLTRREDLFALDAQGHTDPIHFNQIGAWLMAMTHYAVIYQKSPVGLPLALPDSNGQRMAPLSEQAARALQTIVWQVVTNYPLTGVPNG